MQIANDKTLTCPFCLVPVTMIISIVHFIVNARTILLLHHAFVFTSGTISIIASSTCIKSTSCLIETSFHADAWSRDLRSAWIDREVA